MFGDRGAGEGEDELTSIDEGGKKKARETAPANPTPQMQGRGRCRAVDDAPKYRHLRTWEGREGPAFGGMATSMVGARFGEAMCASMESSFHARMVAGDWLALAKP
ncbi:hypothetical protein BHM03_00019514 [Ensete ventricosum]|nr:hypothetical protein BHM03_00019514 [Ensete ventricosum]